nr:MAG: polymerase PA [Xinjiang sediment orthomyxo-like virus 1]
MNFANIFPPQAWEKLRTLKPEQFTGTESEQFKWVAHYLTCVQLCDDVKFVDGSQQWIVLEGVNVSTVNLLLNNSLSGEDLPSNYTPDVLKKGRDVNGLEWNNSTPDRILADPPRIIEVTLSWNNNPQGAIVRKKNKLAAANAKTAGILCVDVFSQNIIPVKFDLLPAQSQSIMDFITQMVVNLTNEQRAFLSSGSDTDLNMPLVSSILPSWCREIPGYPEDYMEDEDAHALTHEHVMGQLNNLETKIEQRKGMKILTHYDGSPLSKGDKIPEWKGIWPVQHKFYTSQKTATEILTSIFKKNFRFVHGSCPKAAEIAACINELRHKETFNLESDIKLSDPFQILFGIGRRKERMAKLKLQEPYKVWDYKREISRWDPWMDKLCNYMQNEDTRLILPKTDTPVWKDIDQKCNRSSHLIMSTYYQTNSQWLVFIIEAILRPMTSYVYNRRDGLSFGAITFTNGNSRYNHGCFIKGPSHPKRESDMIPYLILQFCEGDWAQWTSIIGKRAIFETDSPGLYLVATFMSITSVKLRHWLSFSRVLVQTSMEVYETYYSLHMSAGMLSFENLLSDTQVVNFAKVLFAENVFAALQSDPQVEGFLANFRRLYMMAVCHKRGLKIFQWDTSDSEGKCQECIISNPYVLYVSNNYNGFLIEKNLVSGLEMIASGTDEDVDMQPP